jgi:Mn2+/Fe2+ NRAMP family transporter
VAIIGATLGGVLVNLFNLDPVQILIYTALLYGIITPPIIFLLLKIANNRQIMGNKVNNWLSNTLGILALLVMTAAAILFLFS